MAKLKWQLALDVLTTYHTNRQIAGMVGASAASVSGWRSGRHEPNGEHKLALIEVAETRVADDFTRLLGADDDERG